MPNARDYTVGVICDLGTESLAAEAVLEEKHSHHDDDTMGHRVSYTLGKVGVHNVVIAIGAIQIYTWGRRLGTYMRTRFPKIELVLYIGICGGAPSKKHDIRLGDVVVGTDGVVHGDFGRTYFEKRLRPAFVEDIEVWQKPPRLLSTAAQALMAQRAGDDRWLEEAIDVMLAQNPQLQTKYQRPEPETDKLFRPEARHYLFCHTACSDNPAHLAERIERNGNLAIHYGKIASTKSAIRSALTRDRVSSDNDVLCIDMGGELDGIQCLSIRGICDYTDGHNCRPWEGYAALAAAAYAKDLIHQIPTTPEVGATSGFQAQDGTQNMLNSRARHAAPPQAPKLSLPELGSLAAADLLLVPVTSIALPRPCYVMYAIMMLIVTGSALLGLYYTVRLNKMGDGFTAAGWIVAVGTLALAGPVARHYPHCTCWRMFGHRFRRVGTLPTS